MLILTLLCRVRCKSLSGMLKVKESQDGSNVDSVMNTKEEDQGLFGLIGENLNHLQDMVYDLNGQMRTSMESGGVPILKQAIDTMRLWQRQANRFTKSLGLMFG